MGLLSVVSLLRLQVGISRRSDDIHRFINDGTKVPSIRSPVQRLLFWRNVEVSGGRCSEEDPVEGGVLANRRDGEKQRG